MSNIPPTNPETTNSSFKIEKHESDEFSTNEGTHIAQQDDKNNIQTKKQDKLRSDKGFFKIGNRSVKKPTPKELEAAKKISRAARKEGNKLRIGMAILGVLGAVASVAAAIATCGAAPLIGLAVAALVVGGGVVAGNRRESGTQAAYAQTEQCQRNTFQLEDDQTAAGRLQDVQAYMKEEAAQRKAEEKAAKENFNAKEFSKGLHETWTKKVPNSTDQPTVPTLQKIQNARQNLGGSMRGIPQQSTTPKSAPTLRDTMAYATFQLLSASQDPSKKNEALGNIQQFVKSATTLPRSSTDAKNEAIQQITAGVTSIASGRASPKTMPVPQTGNTSQVNQIVQKSVNSIVNSTGKIISAIPGTPATSAKPSDIATTEASDAGSVADKGTTEIKPKFSKETLATSDNIATFLKKNTADITEEEFVGTLQFGSTEVRDIYTAAKDQGLSTKDLLSKLIDRQKKYCSDSEFGSGSLIEQIKTFKEACSKQGISDEAIDAVFKEVEGLEVGSGGFFAAKTLKIALSKLDEAGGIKGADGKVLISGDTLKTIFNGAAKLREAVIGNDMSQNQSGTDSLQELTDELEINTLILSEESGSAEGIERLNDATLNITSREGDPQQITLSVRDSKVFYKTTPDGEEKELDEVNKKHIQNALVFNEIHDENSIGYREYMVTPLTLETKQTLLGDIEKASTEPAETAAKPAHKDDAIGDDDGEIGSGDLTESTASKDASEVADKSVDATEDASLFKKLVSQAEGIERGGRKFVSLDELDIQNFEDIAEDGSNLPSGDREMFIAYTRQGKKFGDMNEFFKYCTLAYRKGNPGKDSVKKCRGDFQDACKSAGISPEDQENIWKVVWTSDIKRPSKPTDDEIDAILNTIKNHVKCNAEDRLKDIVKNALKLKNELAFDDQIGLDFDDEDIIQTFGGECNCPVLKLGENSENVLDGAILYVNIGDTFNDGTPYPTPVKIEYLSERDKIRFVYEDIDGQLRGAVHGKTKKGSGKKVAHSVEINGGNKVKLTASFFEKALHDAFVFGPVGEEGNVMPLQEKLNVDEKLAIFTEKNKKAAAAAPAPAEPLDPVAAAAAKVNIANVREAFELESGQTKFKNVDLLPAEDICIEDIRVEENDFGLSRWSNNERSQRLANSIRDFLINMEETKDNIDNEKCQELYGFDPNKFNITDEQKLNAVKYLQGKYCERRKEFDQACAKIGFMSDEQKELMYDLAHRNKSVSDFNKLYETLKDKPGFSEISKDDIENAYNAVKSLCAGQGGLYSDNISDEDIKAVSEIINRPIVMAGDPDEDGVHGQGVLGENAVIFVNGEKYNCKLEINSDEEDVNIPTKVTYTDSKTGKEKSLTFSETFFISPDVWDASLFGQQG